MHLYLIRHGTTTYNLEGRHQTAESPLAEEGVALIHKVAEKLKVLDVQIIISSHFSRALKTAEIINQTLNVPLVVNETLREIKRPTLLEGRLHTDAEVIEIKKLIRENYHIADWHHSDEENFYDLKKRALGFLEDMESKKYEKILVVTHGIVIKMIAALVVFGKELDPDSFINFYDNTSVSNGGLTIFRFQENKWKLRSLNAVL